MLWRLFQLIIPWIQFLFWKLRRDVSNGVIKVHFVRSDIGHWFTICTQRSSSVLLGGMEHSAVQHRSLKSWDNHVLITWLRDFWKIDINHPLMHDLYILMCFLVQCMLIGISQTHSEWLFQPVQCVHVEREQWGNERGSIDEECHGCLGTMGIRTWVYGACLKTTRV